MAGIYRWIDWLIDFRGIPGSYHSDGNFFFRQILNPVVFHFDCYSVYNVKYGICLYVSSR